MTNTPHPDDVTREAIEAVAGPITEDVNGDWSAEVHLVGGHEIIATAHGATRQFAEGMQTRIIEALTRQTTPPAEGARKLVSIADRIDQQADCLDGYAESSGHAAPSMFHLQSIHFRDLAAQLRALSPPPANEATCQHSWTEHPCPSPGQEGREYCELCPAERAANEAVERLRPEVLAFAHLMEQQLRANDHKPGWKNDRPESLTDRCREELNELDEAVTYSGLGRAQAWNFEGTALEEKHAARLAGVHAKIGREAADVANMAMMVADVVGALPALTTPEKLPDSQEAVDKVVERLRAAWDASTTLPPIEFSDAEAEALARAILRPSHPDHSVEEPEQGAEGRRP